MKTLKQEREVMDAIRADTTLSIRPSPRGFLYPGATPVLDTETRQEIFATKMGLRSGVRKAAGREALSRTRTADPFSPCPPERWDLTFRVRQVAHRRSRSAGARRLRSGAAAHRRDGKHDSASASPSRRCAG